MAENGEKRFGWAALLAAGFGGIVVGNLMDDGGGQQENSPSAVTQDVATFASAPVLIDDEPAEVMPLAAMPVRAAEPEPEPVEAYLPPAPVARSVYYRNCSDARAAGAAPVYRDSPGYGGHLDRDGDGKGCE